MKIIVIGVFNQPVLVELNHLPEKRITQPNQEIVWKVLSTMRVTRQNEIEEVIGHQS